VAKIASAAAKPDGLLEVGPEEVRAFLDPLPVGRIWGVGPVARERLEKLGFQRVGDLARANPKRLRQRLGDWGADLGRLARGEDLREVSAFREAVGMSEENTFSGDVSDRHVLEAAAITHAEAVARRLRRSGRRARTVVLKLKLAQRVRTGPRGYPLLTRRTTLAEPSDDGEALASAARELLAQEALTQPVRLLGVGVTNLVDGGDARQLPLFGAAGPEPRRARLNRALDAIAERFGSDAVARGVRGAARRAGLTTQIKSGETEAPTENGVD